MAADAFFCRSFTLTDFAVTTECILRLPAHSTRRLLTLEFPAFVIAVCRTLFPLESSPGQSPVKLTKDFAFEKREKSPISATIEMAQDITDSRDAHQGINFFPHFIILAEFQNLSLNSLNFVHCSSVNK